MNLCRCDNGHFYDKEKFAACPHCAGGSPKDDSLTSVYTAAATEPAEPISDFPAPDVTEQYGQVTPFPVADIPAAQPTVGMLDGSMDTPTVPLQPGGDISHLGVTTETFFETVDNQEDHTIGYFDMDFSAASAVGTETVPLNDVSTPCVGWLVALGGAHIGTDYRLKVGKNFIGRNSDMDISLQGDKSVSRDRHAIVVYEPKTHMYLVQPGESSSLVYRNNEVVLNAVKLEAYDTITVGDINLLFIPLCGERFNWTDLFEQRKMGH